MFENLKNIFKKNKKKEMLKSNSKDTAKERLHLVLMQDRANVSADFLDLMRKEIIEVIKKYIDIDEKAMDVRLTTETNEDGIQGPPALYANIPIINIKDEARKLSKTNQEGKVIQEKPPKQEEKKEAQPVQKEKEEKKQETTKETINIDFQENNNHLKNENNEELKEKPQNISQDTEIANEKVSKDEETTPQSEEKNEKENDIKEEKKS